MNFSSAMSVFTLLFLALSLSCLTGISAWKSRRHSQHGHAVTITPLFRFKEPFDEGHGVQGHQHLEIFLPGVAGKNWTMHLELNHMLARTGTLHEFHGEDGVREEKQDRFSPCHYHGKVVGLESDGRHSWAAVSSCDGLEGAFSPDGERVFVVEPEKRSDGLSLSRPHTVHEEKRRPAKRSCGVDHSSAETPYVEQIQVPFLREHVSNIQGHRHRQLRMTSSSGSRYLELLLAVDKLAYADIGGTDAEAKTFVEGVANFLDMVYKPLGIRIALTSAIYWRTSNPISISNGDPDPILEAFRTYRENNWIKDVRYPNDNAQLITGADFTGSVVGLASVTAVCSPTRSAGINQHGPSGGSSFTSVAYIMAHEMGHNLNMNHDDGRTCNNCTSQACIMASSSGPSNADTFSRCAAQDLTSLYNQGGGSCLLDIPRKLFGDPVCGNGFVEAGEECDCGSKLECTDPCCNATTCKLTADSQCSSGACCTNCRFRPTSFRCRPAATECDVSEYCSGSSGNCPTNLVKSSGSDCKSGEAYCWNGECRTITSQCMTLWGSSSSIRIADHRCYDRLNTEGDEFGNCGKDTAGNFVKCAASDVLCGLLQCQGMAASAFPIIGQSKSSFTYRFTFSNGERVTCRAASVDLGKDIPDPGLGLDGIKCGTDSVCENKHCVAVVSANDVIQQRCNPPCSKTTVCTSASTCVDPNGPAAVAIRDPISKSKQGDHEAITPTKASPTSVNPSRRGSRHDKDERKAITPTKANPTSINSSSEGSSRDQDEHEAIMITPTKTSPTSINPSSEGTSRDQGRHEAFVPTKASRPTSRMNPSDEGTGRDQRRPEAVTPAKAGPTASYQNGDGGHAASGQKSTIVLHRSFILHFMSILFFPFLLFV